MEMGYSPEENIINKTGLNETVEPGKELMEKPFIGILSKNQLTDSRLKDLIDSGRIITEETFAKEALQFKDDKDENAKAVWDDNNPTLDIYLANPKDADEIKNVTKIIADINEEQIAEGKGN